MMDFEKEACELNGCTITDKSKPCPMFGCQRTLRALRSAHRAGVAQPRSVVYEVHNKTMLLLFGTREGADAYMGAYACATNGMEMREVRLMDAPAVTDRVCCRLYPNGHEADCCVGAGCRDFTAEEEAAFEAAILKHYRSPSRDEAMRPWRDRVEVLLAIAKSMPQEPELGDWNWPQIAEECRVLLDRKDADTK